MRIWDCILSVMENNWRLSAREGHCQNVFQRITLTEGWGKKKKKEQSKKAMREDSDYNE